MLLLTLVACQPQTPAACTSMCASAADLYGGCLEGWGVDWTAAGFDDEAAFVDSCETWAWEMTLLEQDAVERGEIDEGGWLAPVCRERDAAFGAPDATCDAYTSIDWNDTPWQAPEDTGGG